MDPKSEMSSRGILSASRKCLNLFEQCWLRKPDAIVELEAAERRFRAWTNKLNVFSESASLDAQLRAAKCRKIREITMLLLTVLHHNLLLAFKLISSGRNVTSDIEAPLFCIRESLKRLENFAAVTIDATQGSLIKRTIVFAEKHDNFQELSRMFSIAILSRYSALVPRTGLGASPTEVSEDFVPTKDKIMASLPEGLFLALMKSSLVRHFRILYERDEKDRNIKRSGPAVTKGPTDEVCDPADKDMNDSPTTSEAGVALCPRAPKILDGQKTGTCPICKQILPAEEFKNPNWISHVMKDIQPYVCLSRDCMSDLQFFERRQDWIKHMHNFHTTSWICSLHNTYVWKCSICKLTSPTDFVSEEEVEDSYFGHINEFHTDIEQSMRSDFLICDTMPQPRSSEFCPICGTRDLAQVLPHGEDKSHTRETNPHGVENCIANHLRTLAFSFISRFMDDGQQDANIPSSRASNNDQPDLDDLPEIGPDDECPMLPLEKGDEIDRLPIPDKEKLDMQSCIAQNLQALQVRSDEQTQWNFNWVNGCRVVEPNMSEEERERLFPANRDPGNNNSWSGTDPTGVPASIAYIACLFIIVKLYVKK